MQRCIGSGDAKSLPPAMHQAVIALAANEPDAEVRSQILSTARRLPQEHSLPLIAAVLSRDTDAKDAFIPLMAWFTLESLTAALTRAAVDDSQGKVIARITRAELIVVDDIGMLPAGQAAAEAFYRLVDATYERRSLAVTSNLHPAGFDTFMPKTLATAAVDRLLHHAHVIVTEGTSLRLAEATAGKGVVPLH